MVEPMRCGTQKGRWAGAMLGAVLCMLAAPAPGFAGDAEPLRVAVPAPSGRFEVGTRAIEMVDRSRRDTPGSPGARRLMVQVTYPRADRGSCHPSLYISRGVIPILSAAVGLHRPTEIATGICRGGRVAPGAHPLLVFSHAFTADRFVYASLVNDLASRGYVVVAPDHPPDAFAVQYPGGEVVEGEYGRPLAPADITTEEIAELNELRTDDARFVVSRTLKLARAGSGFLAGGVDGHRIGILGHSLGGSTATRAAQVDRRFDAAVDLDGSLFGDWTARTGDRTPYMLLAAEGGVGGSFAEQPICTYMAGLRGPHFALDLEHALHFSYSDFQALAPRIAAADPSWAFAGLYQAVVGTIDPERSIAVQRRALARFFARYVKGKRVPRPHPFGPFSRIPIRDCSG
jgi:dienelactone hydrolase